MRNLIVRGIPAPDAGFRALFVQSAVMAESTFTKEDEFDPVYCERCHVHVPRLSLSPDGFCAACKATVTAEIEQASHQPDRSVALVDDSFQSTGTVAFFLWGSVLLYVAYATYLCYLLHAWGNEPYLRDHEMMGGLGIAAIRHFLHSHSFRARPPVLPQIPEYTVFLLTIWGFLVVIRRSRPDVLSRPGLLCWWLLPTAAAEVLACTCSPLFVILATDPWEICKAVVGFAFGAVLARFA